MIYLTKHAKEKFAILQRYGFRVTKKRVIDTLNSPDLIDYSRSPLYIAQKKLDSNHVLRVIYKVEDYNKIIITFYPGRIKQYGKRT